RAERRTPARDCLDAVYVRIVFLPVPFVYCTAAPRALPSFPTRRSSDLRPTASTRRARAARDVTKQTTTSGRTWRPVGRRSRKFTDRKSTRLNSSHVKISYAGFCLKKKKPARPCRLLQDMRTTAG